MRWVPKALGPTYLAATQAVACRGEVWLHEWLHGACGYFAKQGFSMPDGDADGAGRHGYLHSRETGWTNYYRDLMNGRVMEQGQPKGIPALEWDRLTTLYAD